MALRLHQLTDPGGNGFGQLLAAAGGVLLCVCHFLGMPAGGAFTGFLFGTALLLAGLVVASFDLRFGAGDLGGVGVLALHIGGGGGSCGVASCDAPGCGVSAPPKGFRKFTGAGSDSATVN